MTLVDLGLIPIRFVTTNQQVVEEAEEGVAVGGSGGGKLWLWEWEGRRKRVGKTIEAGKDPTGILK